MISRSGIHAVRAISSLARLGKGEFAGAAALAREIGAPQNYLGKLLQRLSRTGMVESRRGAGGGFRLAQGARKKSLLEVLGAVEDPRRWSGCFLGQRVCSDRTPCAMHDRWSGVRAAYHRFLSETTVGDVAERELRFAAGAPPARSRGPRSRRSAS